MLQLNSDAAISLTEQIVGSLVTKIERGVLSEGARLPSVRSLAQMTKVSPFTVAEAYNRLVAAGWIQSQKARGYFVATRGKALAPTQRAPVDEAWLLSRVYEDRALELQAGGGWLPPDWLYEYGMRTALRQLAKASGDVLTRYGHPQGLPELRQHLQWRLALRGIEAPAEQIVLTHGASQGLDLAIRLLVQPGDTVLIDNPGYSTLIAALLGHGAKLFGVPRTPTGPDVPVLAQLAEHERPVAFFTNSALHNPTGTSTTATTAHQILKLADKYNFRVVEDDPFADLLATPIPNLAGLDNLERVIYLGSFSKTLSPALRVGYLAADARTIARATQLKMTAGLTGSAIMESAALNMLTDGHHRTHLDRLRERLAEAQHRVCGRLTELGWSIFHPPSGGLFLWAEAPAGLDTDQLTNAAATVGIALAPGHFYHPAGSPSRHFRFNAAWADNSRLYGWLAGQAVR
ncbi:aminotransferase-like domain-containing protein [Chitinimonas sp. BJB300]|uniref:aminotransferase-like domain-containing protein n=1 Tax=Chitinimonas sp. BJB300 TaxID=1559339 RepID=UPI000C0CFEB9|nr:PLP-dependent aminotransferase family protein [Chitinimonas sp. BJB300]PHV11861.1 GntR family transcriptional regulator [Chitinimonas sp. BJB300]TSJ87776.1 PLP-dependent aminotransferase family protein [Chitinimonas sp. BJB300]